MIKRKAGREEKKKKNGIATGHLNPLPSRKKKRGRKKRGSSYERAEKRTKNGLSLR